MNLHLGYVGLRQVQRPNGPRLVGRLDRDVTVPAGAIVELQRIAKPVAGGPSHVLVVLADPRWRTASKGEREQAEQDNAAVPRVDARDRLRGL